MIISSSSSSIMRETQSVDYYNIVIIVTADLFRLSFSYTAHTCVKVTSSFTSE